VVVIGVGRMGRAHAAKVRALADSGAGVALAGVADRDAARAESVAPALGTAGVANYRRLLPRADAAVVAVPTGQHFLVARDALRAGLDVLVEKPLAPALDQAQALCRLAAAGGRVLQVGHVEWFNPALAAARGLGRAPSHIRAYRTSHGRGTTADVDVVHDLMIHDLHIILHLVGGEPEGVAATGRRVASDTIDVAHARLTFPGGCTARLTANRVSPVRTRRLDIYEGPTRLAIDFLQQSAVVTARRTRGRPFTTGPFVPPATGHVSDVLLTQLRGFLSAVQRGDAGAVSGDGVLGALRTAHRVLAAIAAEGRRVPGGRESTSVAVPPARLNP